MVFLKTHGSLYSDWYNSLEILGIYDTAPRNEEYWETVWRKQESHERLKQIIQNNYAERNVIQEKSVSWCWPSNPVCGLLTREHA